MALSPIDAFCTNCHSKFNQAPEQSLFGFQKLSCPKCQEQLLYPLTNGYRIAYWLVFAYIALFIIKALADGELVSYSGWLCLAVGFVPVADMSISYRLYQARKHSPNTTEFNQNVSAKTDDTQSADQQNLLNKKETKSANEIYRIIGEEIARKEYQQGLMAKAMVEAQGNKDTTQSLYIQFRHEELSSQLEPQRNVDLEQKLFELAEKRRQATQEQESSNNFFIEHRQRLFGVVAAVGVIWIASVSVSENIPQVNTVSKPVVVRKPVVRQKVAAAPSATEILAQYRKAADQGNANAQYKLAIMYKEGHGIAKNEAEALAWLRKSAQGYADAQFSLGRSYETGQGVAKDEVQAVLWYRRAADQGQAEAQLHLGNMYAEGRGIAKDDAQAVAWYQKAAQQGNAEAQTRLGDAYANERGITQNDAQAVAWYRKAAEQGNAAGQNNLGIMYEVGRGIAKNAAEAAIWYRKAAEQGHADAQNNLASMYLYGQGIAKDEAQAVAWYRKAADQGLAEAQLNLGNMYAEGKGIAKDETQAVVWYFKASEQGDEDAKEALRELAN